MHSYFRQSVGSGGTSVRGDSPEKWTDAVTPKRGLIAESKRDFENLVKTLFKPC